MKCGPEDNTRRGENAHLNRRTLNKELRIMKGGPQGQQPVGGK